VNCTEKDKVVEPTRLFLAEASKGKSQSARPTRREPFMCHPQRALLENLCSRKISRSCMN